MVDSFQKIINEQLTSYPGMQITDLYKLIYQAALGSEHFLKTEKSYHLLLEEIDKIDRQPDLPLAERIDPRGQLVRLNLRPYKALHGDPKELNRCFIETTKIYKGSITRLKGYWHSLFKLASQNLLPFNLNSLNDFYSRMEQNYFPAVHHSEVYKSLYQPAYRIIMSKYLGEWGLVKNIKQGQNHA